VTAKTKKAPADAYAVAIPSYRRPATLAAKTLPLLLNGGVDPRRISVFVYDDERAEYEAICSPLGVSIERAEPTLRAARNIIARHYPIGHPVLSIDDDLRGLSMRLDEKRLTPVVNVHELIVTGFATADRAGCHLWGIYPVKNPYFMRPEVTTDLRYIGGGMFGTRFTGIDAVDLVDLDDKEDFERTCRFYLHDGAVLRLGDVCWLTDGYAGAGGMQEYRTAASISAGAARMVELFPDLATLNLKKKSGKAEVRLRDSRRR
jgi:hypothetical protein